MIYNSLRSMVRDKTQNDRNSIFICIVHCLLKPVKYQANKVMILVMDKQKLLGSNNGN